MNHLDAPAPTEILTQLHTLKPQLVQAYGVHKIDIFSSVARNPAHPDSDIDIAIDIAIDIVVGMQPDLLQRVHLEIGPRTIGYLD
ncbi:MAG: hypothetical protein VKJ85_02790 [Prochlorothrix sp.]|nr:hypothetical protein [Prochlorothrix sp.]